MPDLIYTDESLRRIGVMESGSLDLAYGVDQNDFELTLDINDKHQLLSGSLLFQEGSETGGIVDQIGVDTNDQSSQLVIYKGRTWRGMLAEKVLEPPAGEDYYIVSGDLNIVLGQIIKKIAFSDLFQADSNLSGSAVKSYQFERYINAYSGIIDMLKSVGAKLVIRWDGHKKRAILSAKRAVDLTGKSFDSDQHSFSANKVFRPINHLICAGKGSLRYRNIIHVYANVNGEVVDKNGELLPQSLFGLNERTQFYDYSNAEYGELRKSGIQTLQELQNEDTVELNIDPGYEYDIGDIVQARNAKRGIEIVAEITKKIIKIEGTYQTINYEVGITSSRVSFSKIEE